MKLSFETLARIYAAGRNYANLVIGFCASLGLISVAQQKTLTESLAEVYAGVSQIAHGLSSIWQILVVVGGPFVGAVLAWYAQRSATTPKQSEAVAKSGAVVVTSPEVAAATPNPNVVSRDAVQIVSKT